MINLSALNDDELAAVDAALMALDGALLQLLERGCINEQDGVDLEALSEALADERGARAQPAALAALHELAQIGAGKPRKRPDGQWGYAPR